MILPKKARVAIRRLHRHFRRSPRNNLAQMSRAAKAPLDYIDATHKAPPPKPYESNHEVGIDVFEAKDMTGNDVER